MGKRVGESAPLAEVVPSADAACAVEGLVVGDACVVVLNPFWVGVFAYGAFDWSGCDVNVILDEGVLGGGGGLCGGLVPEGVTGLGPENKEG